MSLREDLLNCNKFFILDTNKDSSKINIKVNDKDETFLKYHYNTRNYNKIVKNSAFIYRIPARASENRKFYMFGGGIIDDVVKDDSQDSDGEATALIIKPFRFEKDIYQDDEQIKKIKWDVKNKKATNGHWGNFWSQCGILEISKNDFESLLNIQNIKELTDEAIHEHNVRQYTLGQQRYVDINCNDTFKINIIRNNKKISSHDIDIKEFKEYDPKKQNKTIFTEYMAVKYISKILNKKYKNEVLSDNGRWRYDIVTYNDDDSVDEIIEVHLSARDQKYCFTLSRFEFEQAKQYDNFKIYNIFNLDLKKQSCDLEILGYKDIIEKYNLVPIAYRVEEK